MKVQLKHGISLAPGIEIGLRGEGRQPVGGRTRAVDFGVRCWILMETAGEGLRRGGICVPLIVADRYCILQARLV